MTYGKQTIVHAAAKTRDVVCAKKTHVRVWRFALAAHLIHISVATSELSNANQVISWVAAIATVAMHVTEETSEKEESRLRHIIQEEARKILKHA